MSQILILNSRGREVTLVQQALNRFVTPKLAVDGLYGPKTQNAVRRFQQAAGFKGREIDGIVGPKTMIALFQVFDMKISGTLTPKSNPPAPPPAKPNIPAVPPLKPMPSTVPPPDEIPRRFLATAQLGYQYSQRDGQGLQAQLGLTFRSKDYFPNSAANTIYHGLHTETILQPALGIPLPKSSIYTGQLGVTVQPVTDWLVLFDRLHLLTPTLGVYGQIPLNSPGGLDPASHARVGFNLGLELFHVDIIKDHLAIGISGQESGYWDFTNHRMFYDPSFLGFIQGSLSFGPHAK
jgi:Putative peptidoglycan binding domain